MKFKYQTKLITKILFYKVSRVVKLILFFPTDNVCLECAEVTISILSSQGDFFLRWHQVSGASQPLIIETAYLLVVVINTIVLDILTGERTSVCSMLDLGILEFKFKPFSLFNCFYTVCNIKKIIIFFRSVKIY